MKIPRIRQGMAAVRAASLATVLAFAGCSTTPPPERFHTLLSDDPTAATPVAQPISVIQSFAFVSLNRFMILRVCLTARSASFGAFAYG